MLQRIKQWFVWNWFLPVVIRNCPDYGLLPDTSGYFWVVLVDPRPSLVVGPPSPNVPSANVVTYQFGPFGLVSTWELDMCGENSVDHYVKKLERAKGVNAVSVVWGGKEAHEVFKAVGKVAGVVIMPTGDVITGDAKPQA